MKPIYSAVALCFIAFGTAAPQVMPSHDPWTFASVELKDGKITGHSPPLIPYIGGAGYVLTTEYHVTINGETVVIPRGFLFDGASIPKWVPKWIIGSPFDPEFMLAALVHDWLYWSRQWPQEKADDALRGLLLASGVGSLRSGAMHRAVRSFGASRYKEGPEVKPDSLWIIKGDDICPLKKVAA